MAHCCNSGSSVSGPYEPRGRFGRIGTLEVYEAGDAIIKDRHKILLLLPDGFGLALHNIILADRFAKAGWHVIIPDYFEGDPLPIGILSGEMLLSFDEQPSTENPARQQQKVEFQTWFKRHDHAHVSSLLVTLATNLKSKYPEAGLFGVGYCFGGKHVLKLAKSTLKAAASFHPSMVVAEDLSGASMPVYVGLAENDDMVPATLAEDFGTWSKTLLNPDVPFTLQVYSGMGHGFAARPNTQDDDIRKQYEKAFTDTVNFLASVST